MRGNGRIDPLSIESASVRGESGSAVETVEAKNGKTLVGLNRGTVDGGFGKTSGIGGA